MPDTEVINSYDTIYLRDYADFVLKNKLEDFVSVYLIKIHSYKIPLLQFFSHLSEQELISAARVGIIKLLQGIETGKAIDDVNETLTNWKNDDLINIPRQAISLIDITLIYSAQKTAFQSFLPYYTKEVAVATEVINEIEHFYKQIQEKSLQMLELIRKEEQEKRLESEEKYRDLFDNASDLIHIADADGRLVYVNNAWLETLGYNNEEVKGKRIFDFIKQEELEGFRKARTELITGNHKSIAIRTIFLKKTGDQVIAEGFISCKYKSETLEYTRALLHDVTIKLQQEKQIHFYIDQLADREKNLRDIIENAPDGIIVIDQGSSIILWNPKCEEIFGWNKDEVTGKKNYGNYSARCIAAGSPGWNKKVFIHKTGKNFESDRRGTGAA